MPSGMAMVVDARRCDQHCQCIVFQVGFALCVGKALFRFCGARIDGQCILGCVGLACDSRRRG